MRYNEFSITKEERELFSQRLIIAKEVQLIVALRDILDQKSIIYLKNLIRDDLRNERDWKISFDRIFSRLIGNKDLVSSLKQNIGSEINPKKIPLKMFISAQNQFLEGQVSLEIVSLLSTAISVVKNPIGLQDTVIYKASHQLVKRILISSDILVPVLAEAFLRAFEEKANYKSVDRLREIIKSQEGRQSVQIYLGNIFYSFGHQVIYPDTLHKLMLEDSIYNYEFISDFRTVSNPGLMHMQQNAGMNIKHILTNQIVDPKFFRTWSLTLGIYYPIDLARRNCDRYSVRSPFDIQTLANSLYFKSSEQREPLCKPFLNIPIKDKAIKHMIDQTNEFIFIQWRTNTYKNETTDYNNYRNSNELEVIYALDDFTRRTKSFAYIGCEVETTKAKEIISRNDFIFFAEQFESLNRDDYLFLLSRCKFFFSGASGAYCSAGLLFHRPTLVFDWPLFFPIPYHPYCWYMSSDLLLDGFPVNKSRYELAATLPHNTKIINQRGYYTKNNSHSDILMALSIFNRSLGPEQILGKENPIEIGKRITHYEQIYGFNQRIVKGSKITLD